MYNNKISTLWKKALITVAVFAMAFLQGCGSLPEESLKKAGTSRHNICLILDGTDRLCEQAGVPIVTVSEMTSLADVLSEGVGTLYVGYVDDNCDNNRVVLFDWDQEKPSAPSEKKDMK